MKQLCVTTVMGKRVIDDVATLSRRVNALDVTGPRLLPMPGRIFTELDAIHLLTQATATLVASGGVYGAEGASWLGIDGKEAQIEAAVELIKSISDEPLCVV